MTDSLDPKQTLQEAEYRTAVHWNLSRAEGLRYLRLSRHLAKRITRLPEVRKARSVKLIDIGCGDGAGTFQISQLLNRSGLDAMTYGSDFSERAIFLAKEKSEGSENLEFCVSSVDNMDVVPPCERPVVILMREVVEHLKEEQIDATLKQFSEFYPEFHLIITTPSTNSPVEPKHYRHYTKESLTSALERNELQNITVSGFAFRPRSCFKLFSRVKSALNRRPFFWKLSWPMFTPCPTLFAQTLIATADSSTRNASN